MKLKAVSGIMLTLLLVGMLILTFIIQPVRASGTIHIRADGSVDPPTAPISSVDNVTYIFTGNIYDEIIVERDNIVIDGAGCTLQGTGSGTGIDLTLRSNVTIKNIEIKAFGHGIGVYQSFNNIISRNRITNNQKGILFYKSSDNIISGNNIANSWGTIYMPCGIDLWYSSNNFIYHNNFMNNIKQVHSYNSTNVWDDGYPSGGNYWDDYTGVDLFRGPYQNETGSDGLGDTPYTINGTNQDKYPLMNRWTPKYTLTIYSSPTGVTFTVDGVSRITPWSGTYSEGASVSLVMPETHDGYAFYHWLEDGDTNRIKTVTMDTDIMLTAVYTRPPPPVGGKATPINIPMNKPETPTLWIWLSAILLPLIATAVFVKHKKKKQ